MSNAPSISVIIAAYKASATLPATLASIRAQTLQDYEIIIIDDASPDDTLAVGRAQAEGDSRIRVLSAPHNGGPAAARNIGLDAASGDWVAVVDSDDVILPERFAAMRGAGESAGAGIVFDNLFYVSAAGREHLYLPDQADLQGALRLDAFIESHRKSCPVPNLGFLKPLIRRDLIEAGPVRYDTGLKIGEDAMLVMTLMAQGAKAVLLKDPYYRYHRHEGSISARQDAASIAAINRGYADYLDKYGSRIGDGAGNQMRRLIADNESRLQVMGTADHIMAGRLGPALQTLRERPSMLRPLARDLARRVLKG